MESFVLRVNTAERQAALKRLMEAQAEMQRGQFGVVTPNRTAAVWQAIDLAPERFAMQAKIDALEAEVADLRGAADFEDQRAAAHDALASLEQAAEGVRRAITCMEGTSDAAPGR